MESKYEFSTRLTASEMTEYTKHVRSLGFECVAIGFDVSIESGRNYIVWISSAESPWDRAFTDEFRRGVHGETVPDCVRQTIMMQRVWAL